MKRRTVWCDRCYGLGLIETEEGEEVLCPAGCDGGILGTERVEEDDRG